jgi:hypothetical protein
MQQRRHIDLFVIIKVREVIDGKVHHSQERIGIHSVRLTRLLDRQVAKAQIDTKTTQCLKHAIVVLDKHNHLILGLIHLHILHLPNLIDSTLLECKSNQLE